MTISTALAILSSMSSFPKYWLNWWSHLCPTFVPKSGYFLLIWVKVCLKKLTFFYFWANFTSWPFWQHVGSFKQEIHLCPCSGVFGCRFFTILPTCYLKGLFFTNKTREQGTLNCRNYYTYCQIMLIYGGEWLFGGNRILFCMKSRIFRVK